VSSIRSNSRLAIGLVTIFIVVNLFYQVALIFYEPLAMPATLGLVSCIVVYMMRRWRIVPPVYDRDLQKLAAMVNLAPMLKDTFLPFGSYALEPQALVELLSYIQLHQPEVVVECGSGLSTLFIGTVLRQNGHGHLFSIEEDEKWYSTMTRLINGHQLEGQVTLILAPLEKYSDNNIAEIDWYSLPYLQEGLDGVDHIDLLLVDGPKTIKPLSRFPALPVLFPRISEQTLIILDDVNRSQEQAVVARWRELYDIEVEVHSRTQRKQAYIRLHRASL